MSSSGHAAGKIGAIRLARQGATELSGVEDLPDEECAETDAGGSARDRDQRALGEVLQRELPPRRAERDADRRLAGADDGSRQQQRGDVGAGNEKQERCVTD